MTVVLILCTGKIMTPAVQLKRDQQIMSLTRDKDGRGHAYVVTDRIGDAVLCSQRLTAAAAWLNQHVCAQDPINVASLYESAVLGRLVHRRFGVVRTELGSAPRVFAEARESFPEARAIVLSQPHRLTVA